MVTPKERIEQVLDLHDLNVRQLAAATGISPSTLYEITKGNTSGISMRIANCLKAAYPALSKDWLLTGEGDATEQQPGAGGMPIKYYPNVAGTAGGIQFLENPDESYMEFNIPLFSDCTCAINVEGRSMIPNLMPGEIVLLSEWTESFIEWGKIYLVITRSGYRCIKYVDPCEDPAYIVCRSEDIEHYKDFRIAKDDVLRLFIVKGRLSRNFV